MANWQRYWRECCASVCFQIIVITHGFQSDQQLPLWTTDLALAMNQTQAVPQDHDSIRRSVVNLRNDDFDPASNFIIFNWVTKSRWPHTANDNSVSGRLHDVIRNRIRARRLVDPEKKLVDIHFIGHSRGTYVNASAIRRLKDSETSDDIGYLHMTTLDPQNFGGDGSLTSNPGGIVDWADNYYQTAGGPAADVGRRLSGALNVDLTSITRAWSGRSLEAKNSMYNHSEVHDWYHWTCDTNDQLSNPLHGLYREMIVVRTQKQLVAERELKTTRQLFYGTRPVVESFNNNTAPAFVLRGEAKVTEHALLLTSSTEHVAGAAFCSTKVRGNVTAEFTFRMTKPNNFAGADGLTFAVLDGSRGRLGKLGGQLGYAGLSGFAVAFDTFSNRSNHDPIDPSTQISWRLNGQPKWEPLSVHVVPESMNSGNAFRARVNITGQGVEVRLYSFGSDQLVFAEGKFPSKFPIPDEKIIGFTAATGSGSQYHWIDDVIIFPDEVLPP